MTVTAVVKRYLSGERDVLVMIGRHPTLLIPVTTWLTVPSNSGYVMTVQLKSGWDGYWLITPFKPLALTITTTHRQITTVSSMQHSK